MQLPQITVHSTAPSTALPRAFVGASAAYARIHAWGVDQGWGNRSFEFILERWLALHVDASRFASAAQTAN